MNSAAIVPHDQIKGVYGDKYTAAMQTMDKDLEIANDARPPGQKFVGIMLIVVSCDPGVIEVRPTGVTQAIIDTYKASEYEVNWEKELKKAAVGPKDRTYREPGGDFLVVKSLFA